MYRSYSSSGDVELWRCPGGTQEQILLIPSSSSNNLRPIGSPVGNETSLLYAARVSLKKTRFLTEGDGRRVLDHLFSSRSSSIEFHYGWKRESGESKRNKVLARTKSERDRCIIPVLLTAPPQSRSPVLPFSLSIPLFGHPIIDAHNKSLWVSFHPLRLCRLRPTATPAPLFLLSRPLRRFHRASITLTAYATPPFFFSFFFLRFSSLGGSRKVRREATKWGIRKEGTI